MTEEQRKGSVFHMLPQLVASSVLIGMIRQYAQPHDVAFWSGFALTTVSVIFFLTARYQLGRSFSVTPQARQLVVRGVYSRIRNPMYFFSALMILGAVIAFQRPIFLLIPAALVPLQIVRARREARALEAKFGTAYQEYREGTWF
ncbi:MAG: isoprenylcysteine carboxylmethyltransferase family protein [Acidobacteriia bacterium]|nr:isoprenylcysteine carboxylmethyltransferase family protein [Terriglobia bacterium]